jgi:hypothetical protein
MKKILTLIPETSEEVYTLKGIAEKFWKEHYTQVGAFLDGVFYTDGQWTVRMRYYEDDAQRIRKFQVEKVGRKYSCRYLP